MVAAPASCFLPISSWMSACKRSSRSGEKPTLSGFITVISSAWPDAVPDPAFACCCAKAAHETNMELRTRQEILAMRMGSPKNQSQRRTLYIKAPAGGPRSLCPGSLVSCFSVDQLQRKLNLPRISRRLADLPESRSSQHVCRRAHGHDIEEVEEFRTELQVHPLRSAFSSAKRRVLDQRKVEVVKRRSAKRVPPQRPKHALVRPSAPGHVYRNREEIRRIVRAFAKIILPVLARRRELRLRNLVWPIHPT